ncbi:DUF692 domain-containing protein [Streptomyces sp. SID3343]|uniref:DUF692 domain-containing protein n=1 Tax=Streptomyces sp. SID3343 TaxID=2690260 RepID=UPI001F25A408|nr:DUF692 domain-containing protein [Streptomyces sp. SID3343]
MRTAVGIGWRSEIDLTIERLDGVDFVEVVAENICLDHVPESLRVLRARGVEVIPHGVGLGLAGADRPDPVRLAHLAAVATALDSPLVSEHLAFVRAGGMEAGHLLPGPRTWDALDLVAENVRIAQDLLPVPLALENPATLLAWPDDELSQSEFLTELVERTGVRLLVDVANLHTERVNHALDPAKALAALPLEAVAYVHVAGGLEVDGLWHDTHAHPVTAPVLEVLDMLCALHRPPRILLERDANFPSTAELAAELSAIRTIADPPAAPAPTKGADDADTRRARRAARPEAEAVFREPTEEHRESAARQQTALLAALLTGAPVPPGFDPERVRVQAGALAAKRRDSALRAVPELASALGDRWPREFMAWAMTHPKPVEGGTRADVHAFAAHLWEGDALPQALAQMFVPRKPSWWSRLRTSASRSSAHRGGDPHRKQPEEAGKARKARKARDAGDAGEVRTKSHPKHLTGRRTP